MLDYNEIKRRLGFSQIDDIWKLLEGWMVHAESRKNKSFFYHVDCSICLGQGAERLEEGIVLTCSRDHYHHGFLLPSCGDTKLWERLIGWLESWSPSSWQLFELIFKWVSEKLHCLCTSSLHIDYLILVRVTPAKCRCKCASDTPKESSCHSWLGLLLAISLFLVSFLSSIGKIFVPKVWYALR